MAATKKVVAKSKPNRPMEYTYSSGLVIGEETMKVTTGAQGTSEARAPRTTAVVPQEQNGVRVARMIAPMIAIRVLRRRKDESLSAPMYTGMAEATMTLISRNGQFAAMEWPTSEAVRPRMSRTVSSTGAPTQLIDGCRWVELCRIHR